MRIKRIVRKTEHKSNEDYSDNDDILSQCSTDSLVSENEDNSKSKLSFDLSDILKTSNPSNTSLEINIPSELDSKLKTLLISKIKTSLEDIKTLVYLSNNWVKIYTIFFYFW